MASTTLGNYSDHEFGNGGFIDIMLTEFIDIRGVMRTGIAVSAVCNTFCNSFVIA